MTRAEYAALHLAYHCGHPVGLFLLSHFRAATRQPCHPNHERRALLKSARAISDGYTWREATDREAARLRIIREFYRARYQCAPDWMQWG